MDLNGFSVFFQNSNAPSPLGMPPNEVGGMPGPMPGGPNFFPVSIRLISSSFRQAYKLIHFLCLLELPHENTTNSTPC